MTLMPLHHVSYVVRGSMLGPRTVRYFSVGAPTAADALRLVADELGNPENGEFSVQRSERLGEPGIRVARLAA